MRITVNGKQEDIKLARPTIADLLTQYSLQEKTVIIEANGEIIPNESLSFTHLKEGDRLEIVQFVGGG